MIDSFTFGSLEEVSDWIKRLKPLNGDIIHIRYENNRFKCLIKSKSIDAIEALEKQMPKQPYEEYGDMHCKLCGGVVMLGENYCSICGQAIDWSECRWLSK